MKKKTTLLAKAFLMLLATLFSFTGARADELTVYEGTETSNQVPAYIYYFDDFTRCQYVIPAEDLTDIPAGSTITSLKYYTTNGNVPYTTVSTVDVYLMEVGYTTMTGLEPKANGTIVYQGILDVVAEGEEGSLTINFSAPYTYQGGNLLVGIDNTTDSGYKSINFYGQVVAGAAWSGSNTDSSDGVTGVVRNFLPKTTIGFTPSVNILKRPTGLKVSYEGGTEATVSWASEDDLFDIDVNGTVTEDVENPYTLTGLAYETEYTVKVRAKKDGKTSNWSNPVSFTTGVQFAAPTNVAAVSGPTTATVTWAGNATSYNLRYGEIVPGPTAKIILTADDVWGDGSGYQMLLDADATAYGTIIPETGALTTSGDVDASIYAEFEYKSPENADGALATANMVSGSSVTIEIPAGTYDWCITNPTPGDRMWIASGNGTIGGRKDDFVFEGGKVYEFHVYLGGTNDAVDLTISPIIDESTIAWTTVNNVTSPYTISGLTTETLYAVQVQGVYTDGQSQWVGTSFTTLSSNPVPYNIDADLAADGAKLTWKGEGDSYKVRYRIPGFDGVFLYEDFDGDIAAWSTYNLQEGSGLFSGAGYDGSIGFAFYYTTNPPQYLISPAVDVTETATLTFAYANYNASYPESFKVGYSQTTNDPDAFTWSEEVTVSGTDWNTYSQEVPAGTKYIAIQCTSYDCYYLFVDNIGISGEPTPAGEWTEIAATDAAATISGLATNSTYEYQVQSIKDNSATDWSESGEFSLVTLDCDGDNDGLIAKFNGKFAHVTLANRTFYKDGTWNSIYLPFDLTEEEFNNTVLADGELRTLTSISAEDERIKLNFDEAMGMYASDGDPDFIGGFPYIIKWATGSNVVNPEFANVTISAAQYGTSAKNEDESIEISFGGTYDAYEFDAEETSVLFIGENNKLYYPQAGATIGATRCYFELEGVTAGEGSGVKIFSNLDDDDATAISKISENSENNDWYDLSGRKLAGKPMQKGIYVNGGRKVTIK